ncbi:PD40 domain-containing protein [Halobacteriovorax sp. HLS]|uniref:PD40 domain-containing protein n=1 Tax=Halobacteriovorax sp. HLS TaxID=2234000 RepID=UPI000FD789A6|nr:PD40 domain-containing protein [Halobacteriovorax sp. HLS]
MNKIIVMVLVLLSFGVNAQLNIVAVGKAELEQSKVAVSSAITQGSISNKNRDIAKEVMNTVRNDFSFYQKVFSVETELRSINSADINYDSESVNYFVTGVFRELPTGLRVSITAHDINKKKILIQQDYDIRDSARDIGHEFSHYTYKEITGKESIFKSKILFVTDRHGSKKNPVKELYLMDFDGGQKRRLTFHKGVVISPAISNDGSKVLYSLIKDGVDKNKNINLYVLDLETNKTSLISSRKGINSGAVFMPDNESILLTLSHTGNAEIYIMNLKTKALTRLTNHYSPDVDPSINKDGTLMTFLSGRGGKPMIYTMDMATRKVTRISYVGKFNATPRFTPEGDQIAFSSWLDTRFDIFRLDANGNNLARLTKDFGSNEDPTYSNDGQFIAFSSQRVISRSKAVQNIYIMDNDGEIIGSITENFGNCITPRWTKSL